MKKYEKIKEIHGILYLKKRDYLLASLTGQGGYWPQQITASKICIILHMTEKPNSIIIVFIQSKYFQVPNNLTSSKTFTCFLAGFRV